MTISFNNTPANVRVPLFYAEVDASAAGYFSQQNRSLLIGHKLVGASAADNVPILVSTTDQARAVFGVGSMLARMHEVYRANDGFGEIWCLPVPPTAGAAATGTITYTGPTTAGGTVALYIGAQKVQAGVSTGDAAAAVAANQLPAP